MLRALWRLGLVAVLVLAPGGALAAGRVALVVANGAYAEAPLANPKVDAQLVAEPLRAIGFDVTLVEDADLERFDAAVTAFAARAAEADVALFYFAGHGFSISDGAVAQSYLMSTSAKLGSTSDVVLRSGGISLDHIIQTVSRAAKVSVFFVDACRNDPRIRGSGGGRGMDRIPAAGDGDVFVALSTRLGTTADDGPAGQGSAFARAFAAHIGEPNQRLDDAFTRIRVAVEAESGRTQSPDLLRYDLDAPLVLAARSEPAAPAPAPQPAVPEPAPVAPGDPVTLVMEMWRTDDRRVWEERLIPLFEAAHPNINVRFSGTPSLEYGAALDARLAAGTAGDLIWCRPFDASLKLYEAGHLAPLNDLLNREGYGEVARIPWRTDDWKTTFCLPVASVIHGFFYNKEIFDRLELAEPKTEASFFAALERIRDDGRYVPIAMGTADRWESTTVGYYNIGPSYWGGEVGRQELLFGIQKLTDRPWVDALTTLGRWRDFLGPRFRERTYSDSQEMFTSGRAAIYPGGSWEIAGFRANADFEIGAFPPPLRRIGDFCQISDHGDFGIGINAASPNREAAETFLGWLASPEAAAALANAMPGFMPLYIAPIDYEEPLTATFASWRGQCASSIRPTYALLSRGTPNLETEMWAATAAVLEGTKTPAQAAEALQAGLDSWYVPKRPGQ